MILLADWSEVLAYNLRQAGALWTAWAGGAATMRDAYESDDGSASIKRAATLGPDDEPVEPRRMLWLVP